jgi:hypothetical protein
MAFYLLIDLSRSKVIKTTKIMAIISRKNNVEIFE